MIPQIEHGVKAPLRLIAINDIEKLFLFHCHNNPTT